MKHDKIVIGIDQSYTRTGISIAADGKLLKVTSIPFTGCRIKSAKREKLANVLTLILEKNTSKAREMVVICERIRMFSAKPKGAKKNKDDADGFVNIDYIKSTGALIATIVDTALKHGVKTYSVDTNSWKAQIVRAGMRAKNLKVLKQEQEQKQNKKLETILYVKSLGFDVEYKSKTGLVRYDDDASDAACISLYGFLPEDKQKLKLEQ